MEKKKPDDVDVKKKADLEKDRLRDATGTLDDSHAGRKSDEHNADKKK